MTKSPTFTIPGAEGIAAAYAEMRDHGIAPYVARDWLIEQITAAARGDVTAQVLRNYGSPAQGPITTDERLRNDLLRALNIAVAVYNGQRARVNALDPLFSEQGAAAINRAAVIRRTRSKDTERAILTEPRIDTIAVTKQGAAHYVAAVLRIGNAARACSARLTSQGKCDVRLTNFDVLMP